MDNILRKKRLFGVALDASDDPMSLELKWVSIMARDKGNGPLHSDPYDALTESLPAGHQLELIGKFPIPSWLSPRPFPVDRSMITVENFELFHEKGGFLENHKQLKDFVSKNVLPEIPVMIGIDHSATGGVLAALSDRYRAEMISVIVLDRHFDGILPSLRINPSLRTNLSVLLNAPYINPFSVTCSDEYCCGNFWAYLIDNGIVLPENLLFIGVADYPRKNTDNDWNRFREAYLDFEKQGCHFFPRWRFKEPYIDNLRDFINENVTTPYVYVSLDLDVGAMNCIHAARYMDGPGINRTNLLDIAEIIAVKVRNSEFSLIGFDIMEFNMHFLGMNTGDGVEDHTLDVVKDFIATMSSL